VWCALQEFFLDYDRTILPISIEVPGESPRTGYGLAIAANTSPYAYLGKRPMLVHPDASFDRGIDVLATRTLRARTIFRVVGQVLTTGGHIRSRQVDYLRDLRSVTLRSTVPLPLQVDGDYAGEWREVTIESVPDALHVIA
jgi:diacylglycerol kinase family enzyme